MPGETRIYLDACTINRLTDDPSQLRVRQEAEAVNLVLSAIAAGTFEWMASTVLQYELAQNPDAAKRFDSLQLLSYAGVLFAPDTETFRRAKLLEAFGFGAFDAVHLAVAEQCDAPFLLSTDDRFCKLGARLTDSTVAIVNPTDFARKADLR
jgi:predicted nucleic acid-binding protein